MVQTRIQVWEQESVHNSEQDSAYLISIPLHTRLLTCPPHTHTLDLHTSSKRCLCSLSCLGSGTVMAYTRWRLSRFASALQ